MTCKDCIHSGLCYKENDYENFPDRCGDFISDKVLEERPQGEWYHNYQYGWHCSICNKSVKDMPTDNHRAVFNFCPNCGADMRGDDNGKTI